MFVALLPLLSNAEAGLLHGLSEVLLWPNKLYELLEHGLAVFLTTAHKNKFNIMDMSWHTMMEFEPPLVG